MTDTTDIKALRTLSMQRVKEIANGDSMLMGERVDLANTAIRFHKELDVALDAFKNAATELFSAQEQLESERQRADNYVQVAHGLAAEIEVLKGDQVPVYQMYYNGFWRDVDKEHYEHFKEKGSDVRVLFTASQNLVVRPRLEPCLKQVQFERDCEWIEAIKAAGGIVKDGE